MKNKAAITGAAAVPLRILAVSATWQGASDYAFVRAFRRAGHSVRVVSTSDFFPSWSSKVMRAVRRTLRRHIIDEFNEAILAEADQLQPDLFFVFKGQFVLAKTIQQLKLNRTVCIQFYPDVSFHTHGPYLVDSLPSYDWVFTTKSFGLSDMADQLGVEHASFVPHGFDPETHFPCKAREDEIVKYSCDFSFIGNWSSKKQRVMEEVLNRLPHFSCKIWGPESWLKLDSSCRHAYKGQPLMGLEYAKAIQLSKINVALLSEARRGASSGDQTTTRTFEIPASGGFMLHERTGEAMQLFAEDRDCVYFSDTDELVEKIRYYLAHDDERRRIAAAGRRRCVNSGYSIDDRARTVIDKYHQIRTSRLGSRVE